MRVGNVSMVSVKAVTFDLSGTRLQKKHMKSAGFHIKSAGF